MNASKLLTLAGLLAVTSSWALPADGLHPNSDAWPELFAQDLSNAEDTKGVWFRDGEGNLTASKDVLLFSKAEYGPFVLDLEFKFDPGANSGVYIYASDLKDLVPNKIEVQLMDDPAPCWKNCTPYQRTAALYGHCKPKTEARGQQIRIVLNNTEVIDENLSAHASNKINPDGSKVPPLHTKPWAEIATRGRIGLQGKHQGASTYFRNIRVQEGDWK